MLQVKDIGYISEETRAGIVSYLTKTANLMPLALVKAVAQIVGQQDIIENLC